MRTIPAQKTDDSEKAESGNAAIVEWDKIPRLPLSEIVRSLGCAEIRRIWDKRSQILSDDRLKNLLVQWKEHCEPNPKELIEQLFEGYQQDHDAVGLILLCSYFEKLQSKNTKPTITQSITIASNT
jgi:hypothetical protein